MRGFLRGCIEVPAVGILLLGLALVALSRKIMDRSPIVALCAVGAMLFACKHSEKLEISASGRSEAIRLETSQSDTVTTRSEGPERVTTTVEEFSAPIAPPEEEERARDVPDEHANREAQREHQILLKRTVTVAERGPVLTESHVAAKDAITATAATSSVSKAVHEEKSAPFGLWGFLSALWPVWLVGGIAGAIWLFLKARKLWPG